MTTREARLQERLPVNLSVRYSTARDYVLEYAENLSVGGLFIRGATDLTRGQSVKIEMTLPGYGTFEIDAMVAHILSPEAARSCQRNPGAGFNITRQPSMFSESLRAYLLRLGQRRDHTVLVSDQSISSLLEEAGYHVRPLPLVDYLLEAVTKCERPVIGVIVPEALATEYLERATAMGAPELILPVDDPREIDDLLSKLDNELFGIT
jgi:hypothetical protein